ncbi:MAG TPA: hypothetical protein GX708_23130 [Gallicola sp.]|nr:hypothetical protein [Gallicola sp.]
MSNYKIVYYTKIIYNEIKMNKLLQINSVVNSGSTGRIAEEIGQIAIAADWESFIAYGRHARKSQSESIKIGSDWDIKWHGLQTHLFY